VKSKFWGLLPFLFLLAPGQLSAQALFDASSFPKTVTATGQTEVTGSILVILRAGTTVPGNLLIDMSPLTITNASAADISVMVTGSITVGGTSVDITNNLVRIPVNAGASSGSIRVDGIRVAIAGTGITSANAKLSWENSLNVLTSGSSVTVINSVQNGLTADPVTDGFVIFNGQVYKNTSTISVHEGYASAFSSSRSFGQTVSTQIRIRVTDFPDGLERSHDGDVYLQRGSRQRQRPGILQYSLHRRCYRTAWDFATHHRCESRAGRCSRPERYFSFDGYSALCG
jgi:hypothetical protein